MSRRPGTGDADGKQRQQGTHNSQNTQYLSIMSLIILFYPSSPCSWSHLLSHVISIPRKKFIGSYMIRLKYVRLLDVIRVDIQLPVHTP